MKPTGTRVGRPAPGHDGAYTFRLPAALIARIDKAAKDSSPSRSPHGTRSAIVRKALELGLDVMERKAKSRSPNARRQSL
jgi:hypothetical protein